MAHERATDTEGTAILARFAASQSDGAVHAVRTADIARRPGEVHCLRLEDRYRAQNTFKVHPGDIAQAVLRFASVGRSGKGTGNVLDVDGGAPAAYPR